MTHELYFNSPPNRGKARPDMNRLSTVVAMGWAEAKNALDAYHLQIRK